MTERDQDTVEQADALLRQIKDEQARLAASAAAYNDLADALTGAADLIRAAVARIAKPA